MEISRSDNLYSIYASLHTAAVANIRSGNERCVKYMKHYWLVEKGSIGSPSTYITFLSDVCFMEVQSKIMYSIVY